MRKFLVVLAAFAVLVAAPASAADQLLYRGQPVLGYPASIWNGFYAGINAGWGRGTLEETPTAMGPFGEPFEAIHSNGFFAGIQGGYNHQRGRLVLGLETDFQLNFAKGSRNTDFCPGCVGLSVTNTLETKMPWWGSVRGRIGFTPWETLLVYATGGVAYGKAVGTNTLVVSVPGFFNFTEVTKNDQFGVGPAFGGGIEWAFAPNWSAKVEYLHLDFGLMRRQVTNPFGSSVTSIRQVADLLRMGINYRF